MYFSFFFAPSYHPESMGSGEQTCRPSSTGHCHLISQMRHLARQGYWAGIVTCVKIPLQSTQETSYSYDAADSLKLYIRRMARGQAQRRLNTRECQGVQAYSGLSFRRLVSMLSPSLLPGGDLAGPRPLEGYGSRMRKKKKNHFTVYRY